VTAESGLIAARFVHFAALAFLFGLALFPRYALPGGGVPALRIKQLLLAAAAVALVSALGWFMFTTASMTGRLAGAGDPAALVLVLRATEFGQVWLLRLVLLAALIVLLVTGRAAPVVSMLEIILAALVVASLAWVGHGGEGQGSGLVLHRLADAVHLLAGSLWIGALVALVLLHRVARSTAEEARVLATALLRFSGIGPAMVVLLIFTGLINSWFLVGPEHALSLAASSYGLVLAAKYLSSRPCCCLWASTAIG
jgi:putative copper resistance protein D